MSITRPAYPTYRAQTARAAAAKRPARVIGAHDALTGRLAAEAGFDAVWASSLEASAARCLPDASLLTMTEFLESAARTQHAIGIPVVADVDTGYGGPMNVALMVREFEAAGITAVAMEDKHFPKLNSFADGDQSLIDTDAFCAKVAVAKDTQTSGDFTVIARTEALIAGLGVETALERCRAYVAAGADAVLIHSKAARNDEILAFLNVWEHRAPVVVVPTTYPDWDAADAYDAGVGTIIYANHSLRAAIAAQRDAFAAIMASGSTAAVEDRIAAVSDVFALQDLTAWQALETR